MTKEQIEGFKEALAQLSIEELYELKENVDEQVNDLYFCDENFFRREEKDSYIYIVVYEDLTYHYDYLGQRAYNEYMHFERAKRIECKTKDLFPEYKLLMSKGEL